jgi:hypothetical protein
LAYALRSSWHAPVNTQGCSSAVVQHMSSWSAHCADTRGAKSHNTTFDTMCGNTLYTQCVPCNRGPTQYRIQGVPSPYYQLPHRTAYVSYLAGTPLLTHCTGPITALARQISSSCAWVPLVGFSVACTAVLMPDAASVMLCCAVCICCAACCAVCCAAGLRPGQRPV